MQTYDNLAQRGIAYFTDTMADFTPVKSKLASEKEQRAAYDFIKNIYGSLYQNPELLGFKLLPDDCFLEWWTSKKEKPGLTSKIRNYIKKTNQFIETIYEIVYHGQADGDRITVGFDVKPGMLKKLAVFSITAEKNIFTFPEGTVKGLKLLALVSTEHSLDVNPLHKQEKRPFTLFSHGVFNPEKPYTVEAFRRIFENKAAYDKLINYFENNGFTRVDDKWHVIGIGGDAFSFDYMKFYGKPEGKINFSGASRNYSGIEIKYNEALASRTEIRVHIPFFKELLEHTDKMSPSLKRFISGHNQCGYCGWCAKGKPPKFAIIDDKHICTVWIFGYAWNHFYEGTWLPDEVGELMDFIDVLFKDRRI